MKKLSFIGSLLSAIFMMAAVLNAEVNFDKFSAFSYKKFLFLKIFDASLYVESAEDFKYSGKLDFPMKLELKYNRNIERKQLIDFSYDILAELYSDFVVKKYRDDLAAINSFYTDVEAGDTYALEYLPGRGLTLYKNNEQLTFINGDKFARFYLKIWLGEHSLTRDMSEALLKNG